MSRQAVGEQARRGARGTASGSVQVAVNQPTPSDNVRAGRTQERVSWRVSRVWEHLLGGIETFTADRDLAAQLEAVLPGARQMVWANRTFTHRVVTHLLEAGIEQFLDLGCGQLSTHSVHETLVECGSPARSVHVDIDPVAVDRATGTIADSSRARTAAAVRADLREPSTVFDHRAVREHLDFDRPVAAIAAGVLAHLGDTAAAGLLSAVRETTVAGSLLAVTHPTADVHAEVNALRVVQARPRSHADVTALLAGWQLREPGVVWAPAWQPTIDAGEQPTGGRGDRYLLAAIGGTR